MIGEEIAQEDYRFTEPLQVGIEAAPPGVAVGLLLKDRGLLHEGCGLVLFGLCVIDNAGTVGEVRARVNGAPTIDSHLVVAGIELLKLIMRDNTPAPSVVPTNRGTVQFEWHTRGVDLEIEIVSPQRVHMAFEDAARSICREEDITWDVSPLVEAINWLSYDG